MVKIITDATASLSPDAARAMGITVVPVPVQVGRETFLDGVDPVERFYALLAGGALPTTSTPSPGVFADTYRRLGQEAGAMVSVHVAATKSAVCQASRMAAAMLPDLEIHTVDSGQVSMGLGLLAAGAAALARAGRSGAEVARWLQAAAQQTRVFAAIRDLTMLRRSGRVSLGKALIAGMLSIKPVLQIRAGAIDVADQVRSWPRAVERVLELAQHAAAGGVGRLRLAVVHTNCLADAHALRDRLGALFPGVDVWVAEAGPSLAAHAGPGALGVCLLREPPEFAGD